MKTHSCNTGTATVSATEQRALLWHRFAQQCIDAMCDPQQASMPPKSHIALQLASLRPWRMAHPITLLYAPELTAVNDRLAVVNAAPVGLCAAADADTPPVCLALGIVRSVDPLTGTLYVLTDAPPEVLASVSCVVGGRLELPTSLLSSYEGGSSGYPPVHCPYIAAHCLTAEGTGSRAIRSRNNLLRMGGERG